MVIRQLLKPCYHGRNGYRYYEEKELLRLQQILFFRELGFELSQIQKIINRSDFDQIVALRSHRARLQKDIKRTQELIATIDKTLNHLTGKEKMKESDMYGGFDRQKQAAYEKELIERFGEGAKESIAECQKKIKDWGKREWEVSSQEFDQICQELTALMMKGLAPVADEVQNVVKRHYFWIKRFWTPTQESYRGHGEFIVQSDLKKAYDRYHSDLAPFLCQAISHFAESL